MWRFVPSICFQWFDCFLYLFILCWWKLEQLDWLCDECAALLALHKKWSFPLRISSVNVTKFTGNCGFGHIYWRNPLWKTSFFVQCGFSLGACCKGDRDNMSAEFSIPGRYLVVYVQAWRHMSYLWILGGDVGLVVRSLSSGLWSV